MDDLLNKLVAIKAESFVDAKTKTGLDKPALVVSASFDEGKFERVRFGQVGETAYGVRDGEAGVAKIDCQLDARRHAGVRYRGDAEGADARSEGGRKEVSATERGRSTSPTNVALARRSSAAARRRRRHRRRVPRPALARRPRNSCAAISRPSSPTAPSTTRSGRCRCNRSSRTRSLYSLNPARMQTPASNQKLITSAVAADRLGWDYRYTTKIYATGPLSSGGDLDGDLVIVSNGDPTINPRHPDRWGAFDAWAKQLYAKGIRRVGGQLIGDDNAFAEPGYGFGWAWDDLVPRLRRRRRRAAIQREPGRAADRSRGSKPAAAPSSACRRRAAASFSITPSPRSRKDNRAASPLERIPGSNDAARQRPGGDRLAGDQRARRRAQSDHAVSERASRSARAQRHLRRRQFARHRRCARQA